jgi:hypothetical protein
MRSSFEINPGHMMSEVYSYPFPEVREIITSTQLDPRFMQNTLPVDEAQEYLKPYGFEPPLELPMADDGSLDLDELHEPIIDRIQARVAESLPGIESFANRYPCHGSSPAMFALIAEWHAQGKMDSLAVLDGEYEGYSAYAEALNVPTTRYASLSEHEPIPGEVWFVSNPSAVDGNWIDDKKWQAFVEAGHEIVYDAAYVGLTQDGIIDVSAANIRAVLTSPSKIFGVFRYRATGITYTREPVKSMYGTKWFKDIEALLETLKLYESFEQNELPRRYADRQKKITQALSHYASAEIVPADVLLLANHDGQLPPEFDPYKRGTDYRFGLTKLFEDDERSAEN